MFKSTLNKKFKQLLIYLPLLHYISTLMYIPPNIHDDAFFDLVFIFFIFIFSLQVYFFAPLIFFNLHCFENFQISLTTLVLYCIFLSFSRVCLCKFILYYLKFVFKFFLFLYVFYFHITFFWFNSLYFFYFLL